ncbi:MAG: hypothetical protein Q4E99_05350 [Bacillota bacterium]|nr:hypothetical protein [Bacillota bacterium]
MKFCKKKGPIFSYKPVSKALVCKKQPLEGVFQGFSGAKVAEILTSSPLRGTFVRILDFLDKLSAG